MAYWFFYCKDRENLVTKIMRLRTRWSAVVLAPWNKIGGNRWSVLAKGKITLIFNIFIVFMDKKSRENTREEIRRMKKERKKRKRLQRNLNKEKTLASGLQIEKARLEEQRKICDYIARKYYDRWHSLLKREEASRKTLTSIPRQSVTQRKVFTIF